MWVITDENGRVTECGDGCLLDDRIEVGRPNGLREEYCRNWVLLNGKLEHDPIMAEIDLETETRLIRARLDSLAERGDFMDDCIAELAIVTYGEISKE